MLQSVERDMLRFMFKNEDWHTTNKIADGSGIAWATAKKYLINLYEKGYVKRGIQNNRIYWKPNE